MFYEPVWQHDRYKLVRRPDTGNYYITWSPPGSGTFRRVSTRTARLDAAKRALLELAASRSAIVKPRDPGEVSLRAALHEYVEKTLSGRPSQDDCRYWLLDWTAFLDGEGIETIGELTPDAQDRYVTWRRTRSAAKGRSLSNATLNRELDVVRAAIGAYHTRGLLIRKPVIKSLPKPPPRDRFLTVEEVRRMLRECRPTHLRRYVIFALNTLQRPAAILGLHARQVDLDRNRIDFLPAGALQSKKRRPIVPITATLRPELERAIESSESGYLIEFEGRPISSIKTAFRKAAKRAGLQGVSPYTLRHTGATLLAGAGVSLWEIGGMLGHSHQRTTEIYAKHTPEYLAGAAKGLDDLFGGIM